MKCSVPVEENKDVPVAPFTGAWIEIRNAMTLMSPKVCVAPFTGAWIEMILTAFSLMNVYVAPFTGAWIEISYRPA